MLPSTTFYVNFGVNSVLVYFQEESFYSLIFTSEPQLWATNFSPEGALKKWLLADRKAPVAAWAPNKAYQFLQLPTLSHYILGFQDKHLEYFKAGGWYAPTNWYRSLMLGTMNEGDKSQFHVAAIVCFILIFSYPSYS